MHIRIALKIPVRNTSTNIVAGVPQKSENVFYRNVFDESLVAFVVNTSQKCRLRISKSNGSKISLKCFCTRDKFRIPIGDLNTRNHSSVIKRSKFHRIELWRENVPTCYYQEF